MLPTSIAGSIRIACPSTRSPASTRAHVDALEAEVAAGLDARAGARRAGWRRRRRRRGGDGLVEQDRHGRSPTGPMKPGGPMRSATSSGCAGRKARAERVLELDLVDPVVAAHDDHEQPRSSVTTGNAFSSAPAGTPSVPGDRVDRRHARACAPSPGAAAARRQLHGLGLRARDLDVRGVAGGERHVVLARRARRHVLVRAEAAHHPDVGLDPVPLEARRGRRCGRRRRCACRSSSRPVVVAVERVRVLHDELARAQHPRARARLVALLGLEVVEDQRQVAVGAHDLGDVERHDLLVRHAPAPARRPRRSSSLKTSSIASRPVRFHSSRRLQDRHRASPGRRSRPSPRARSARRSGARASPRAASVHSPAPTWRTRPGAHHELVRDRLRVGGGLTLRGKEEL